MSIACFPDGLSRRLRVAQCSPPERPTGRIGEGDGRRHCRISVRADKLSIESIWIGLMGFIGVVGAVRRTKSRPLLQVASVLRHSASMSSRHAVARDHRFLAGRGAVDRGGKVVLGFDGAIGGHRGNIAGGMLARRRGCHSIGVNALSPLRPDSFSLAQCAC